MPNELRIAEAWREGSFCSHCRANARYRAIVHALSMALFGRSLGLMEIPRGLNIRGIGLSDWEGFAQYVGTRLNYVNTYYHKAPRLDIVSAESARQYRDLDFVIASEVFEHVPQPVQRAFSETYAMLRPGGVLICSVPYTTLETTLERFPEIHDYTITEREQGGFVLVNTTAEGVKQEFDNLIFHGGEGQTVEMRVFCENSLFTHLRKSGFSRIEVFDQPVLEHGIYWKSAYHEYVGTDLGGYVFAAVKQPGYEVGPSL